MPRIRRRYHTGTGKSTQKQNEHGGTYSFAQFLVILLGIFVIIVNLKAVIEHERGELRLRAASVQTKGNVLNQTIINQIIENAAQKVVSKATSQIEQHLSAFAASQAQEQPEVAVANGKATASSMATEQKAAAQGNESDSDVQIRKPRLPNVLVAGVQRGATTSLTKYLVDQFDACAAKSDRLFFAQTKLSTTSYASLYSNCTDNEIFVDGSPDTIMYPAEVKKLYEIDGSIDDLKIIVTLREPVEREVSSYNYRRSLLKAGLGGTDLLKKRSGAVREFTDDVRDRLLQDVKHRNVKALYGDYADQLTQWFQLFDRKKILILSFTELQRNETDYLDRVHSFLSQQPRRPQQSFPVEAKATYKEERTETHCKFMHFMWKRFFRSQDNKLQLLLKEHPGPAMEQTPFPPFEVQCTPD